MTPEERLRARHDKQAAEEQIGNVHDLQRGRKPRTLLPSDPPAAGATHDELRAWATVALGLGGDPIDNGVRFGSHEDARMVVTLRSGKRLVFDRQADVFDAPILRRRVVIATGATLPHYGPADVQKIATVLVRLAELVADDDDRDEAHDWAHTFLTAAERNTIDIASMATPAGRYEALSILARWKLPADLPPYAPAAERSVIVRDAQTGTRLVRTSDFAAHVRSIVGRPLAWAALHSRMEEIGWKHRGEVEQRQPGGQGKAKAHLYAIPGSWDTE